MWMNSQGLGIVPSSTSMAVDSRRVKASFSARRTSLRPWARRPAAPKLSANLTKSGLAARRRLSGCQTPPPGCAARYEGDVGKDQGDQRMRCRTAVASSFAVYMNPPSPPIDMSTVTEVDFGFDILDLAMLRSGRA
jgi:hypothetical protein